MHADPSSLAVSQIYTPSESTHADPPTQPPTLLSVHTHAHYAGHVELCVTLVCAVSSTELPTSHIQSLLNHKACLHTL